MTVSSKELQAFVCLSEYLHFARASEQLNMTPSALSRLIQRLEVSVDATLFIRDKRSVVLSEQGRVFLPYARDALNNLDEIKHVLQASKDEVSGNLSVFCSVTAAYSILTNLLPSIRERYPDINVLLRTGDASSALDRVMSGQDHMAITAKPQIVPSELLYQEITSTHLKLIISKRPCSIRQHWLSQSKEWRTLPWILAEGGIIREQFDEWAKEQDLDVDVYSHVSGHEAIVSMVSLGFGIGVVPDIVLNYSPQKDDIEVIDAGLALPQLSIGACVQYKSLRNRSINAVWELL
ncbi:MAG: HTH-type transcriptional activator IlvY [Pseudomonadota bacterium]